MVEPPKATTWEILKTGHLLGTIQTLTYRNECKMWEFLMLIWISLAQVSVDQFLMIRANAADCLIDLCLWICLSTWLYDVTSSAWCYGYFCVVFRIRPGHFALVRSGFGLLLHIPFARFFV